MKVITKRRSSLSNLYLQSSFDTKQYKVYTLCICPFDYNLGHSEEFEL